MGRLRPAEFGDDAGVVDVASADGVVHLGRERLDNDDLIVDSEVTADLAGLHHDYPGADVGEGAEHRPDIRPTGQRPRLVEIWQEQVRLGENCPDFLDCAVRPVAGVPARIEDRERSGPSELSEQLAGTTEVQPGKVERTDKSDDGAGELPGPPPRHRTRVNGS